MAIFMVSFYHLGKLDMGYDINRLYLPNLNRIIMNFCAMSVPLFFIINGALIFNKDITIKKTIYRSIKTLLLYYIWILILSIINNNILGIENDISIINILYGGEESIGHLWFLRTLAILNLLVPVLKKFYDMKNRILLRLIIMLLLIFPFLYNYLIVIGKYFDIPIIRNLNRTGLFTMYSILYLIIGGILPKKVNNIKNIKLISIILLFVGLSFVTIEGIIMTNIEGVLFDGVNSSFPTIGALMMSVGIFCLASKINFDKYPKISHIINIIGGNVMAVYIFHLTIILWINKNFIISSIKLFQSIFINIAIILICILLGILLKKIPIIRLLLRI